MTLRLSLASHRLILEIAYPARPSGRDGAGQLPCPMQPICALARFIAVSVARFPFDHDQQGPLRNQHAVGIRRARIGRSAGEGESRRAVGPIDCDIVCGLQIGKGWSEVRRAGHDCLGLIGGGKRGKADRDVWDLLRLGANCDGLGPGGGQLAERRPLHAVDVLDLRGREESGLDRRAERRERQRFDRQRQIGVLRIVPSGDRRGAVCGGFRQRLGHRCVGLRAVGLLDIDTNEEGAAAEREVRGADRGVVILVRAGRELPRLVANGCRGIGERLAGIGLRLILDQLESGLRRILAVPGRDIADDPSLCRLVLVVAHVAAQEAGVRQ